jgi:hypothetical protein
MEFSFAPIALRIGHGPDGVYKGHGLRRRSGTRTRCALASMVSARQPGYSVAAWLAQDDNL